MATSEIRYETFDLAIEPREGGYQAHVLSSPAGEARGDFAAPFSDLELENFRLRIGMPRAGFRRVDSPEMESLKSVGGRLFEAVFNDEVRVCLRGSLARAREEGKTGVRVRLRLNDAPELAALPWEYLYDRSQNQFLSLSVQTPVVRYLELPDSGRPAEVQSPVRVLVMISSPHDHPQLEVEREWALLTQSLAGLEGRITVERLERPTLAALQRKLRSGGYHVFHFVGHGGFDPLSDDGVLVLEDEQGRGRLVSAQ
ncbi:MAG TPA: CHAT domain-containing protein, partial [Longimicrobiaceae bacterium]|nr:CHAT domain-containing protein [Longimicrobiaceae bacterium]